MDNKKYIYEYVEVNTETGMRMRKRISEEEYKHLLEVKQKQEESFSNLKRHGALFDREDMMRSGWTVIKVPDIQDEPEL